MINLNVFFCGRTDCSWFRGSMWSSTLTCAAHKWTQQLFNRYIKVALQLTLAAACKPTARAFIESFPFLPLWSTLAPRLFGVADCKMPLWCRRPHSRLKSRRLLFDQHDAAMNSKGDASSWMYASMMWQLYIWAQNWESKPGGGRSPQEQCVLDWLEVFSDSNMDTYCCCGSPSLCQRHGISHLNFIFHGDERSQGSHIPFAIRLQTCAALLLITRFPSHAEMLLISYNNQAHADCSYDYPENQKINNSLGTFKRTLLFWNNRLSDHFNFLTRDLQNDLKDTFNLLHEGGSLWSHGALVFWCGSVEFCGNVRMKRCCCMPSAQRLKSSALA